MKILKSKKTIFAVMLIIVAVLSLTIVTKYTTSTEFHKSTLNTIEDKKANALKLTGTVALTSTVLAAVPGDSTTAIAEQISELTTPLLIIVCTLYLEKFLLTSIGYLSFRFLIPIACGLAIIYLFYSKDFLKKLAIKLSVFALAIYLIIPVSVDITELIDTTFHDSIAETNKKIDEISENAEKYSKEKNNKHKFFDKIESFFDKVTNGFKEFVNDAKNTLSIFIDKIAVMLITTCVIPFGVIFFFVWIIKLIFGINIDVSKSKKLLAGKKSKSDENLIEES